MSTTTISSALPRLESFRRYVADMLANESGADAVAKIAEAHGADLTALGARLEAATREATEAVADSRRRYDMLTQVHQGYAREVWTSAHLHAQLSGHQNVTDMVRSLAQQSEDGTVKAADLLEALAAEPPAHAYLPHVSAFQADTRYRSGRFVTLDGALQVTFPCVGFAMVDYGPGLAGRIEPVFLVGDRILPVGLVEREQHVTYEELVPMMAPLRVA